MSARAWQVLLVVGAVLVVSAGAAVASAHGGWAARLFLIALALAAAALSVRAARSDLRTSEEILAASAVGLALAGVDLGGPLFGTNALGAAVLAVVFLGFRLGVSTTAAWPLASWAAFQLTVLRGLAVVPATLRTETFVCVALVGVGIALSGRCVVARAALITAAPWWLAGVVHGSADAWAGTGAQRGLTLALMVAAAAAVLLARLREDLAPLLGPARVAPVVAGVVVGIAVTGAFSASSGPAVTLTGYAGVLVATTAAATLNGWRRGLLLPLALSCGTVMTLLSAGQLVVANRWSQLSLLLLLTAVPTVVVALRRRDERPVAVPTAILCLAGAALLAMPEGVLGPVVVGVLLTALYGAAMAVGPELDAPSRPPTARASALCAVAAALVLLTADVRWPALALTLALQGESTLGWALRTGPRRGSGGDTAPGADDAAPSGTAWRVAAVQFVLAAWVAAAAAHHGQVEWYSLSAAAGLLVAAGPALVHGPSWPAWGPALLVAAAPSTLLAVVTADGARAVGVLTIAAAVLVAGGAAGVRAPVMVGAGTLLVLAVGMTAPALPWPLGTALVVGTALLVVGMRRERRPLAGFGRRLAELR